MFQTEFKPAPLGEQQWKELQELEPWDVCRRTSVRYDERGFYSIPFMNQEYQVYPKQKTINGPEGDPLLEDSEFRLLLLVYLLSGQDVPLGGKWVSEKEIKGGALFFKGPHALPVQPLITRFGNDVTGFTGAGKACGGKEIEEYGDAAFKFQTLPRIPAACILWAADDEFPARVSFLFDPSIETQLPLDVILALVRCVVNKLLV